MPLITVSKGGPTTEIPDGVYPVTLTDIQGPRTVTAQRGPNAGQDIDLFDWTFAIDEGELEGVEVQASTSTASGPRSKMYSYLTALFGGQAPPAGAAFEVTDLAGRRALATIRTGEDGWPRIENLGALPASMLGPRQAPVQPTSQQAVVPQARRAPARQQAAGQQPQQGADLPF